MVYFVYLLAAIGATGNASSMQDVATATAKQAQSGAQGQSRQLGKHE